MSEQKKESGMSPVVVLIVCIIYVLSPIDLLPEAALGPFGFIDDGFAIWTAISALTQGSGGHKA